MLGRIYKISNADESIVYIGSTISALRRRWSGHVRAYKQWLNGKAHLVAIYRHFQEHGIDKFSIHLVSEHEVESRQQLFELEQQAMDQRDCCNVRKAYQTYEGHLQRMRAVNKRWRDAHFDQLHRKWDCQCGSTYSHCYRSIHFKSKKHQKWRSEQTKKMMDILQSRAIEFFIL